MLVLKMAGWRGVLENCWGVSRVSGTLGAEYLPVSHGEEQHTMRMMLIMNGAYDNDGSRLPLTSCAIVAQIDHVAIYYE